MTDEPALKTDDDAASKIRRTLKRLSPAYSVLTVLLAIYTGWTIIRGWSAPPDKAVLYVLRDVYIAYDPGTAVGFPTLQAMVPLPGERKLKLTHIPDPPFRVVDDAGNKINKTVWDIEVSVWNGGQSQLGRNKLRTPLTFIIPEAAQVLGVRIINVNELDGVNVVIQPDGKRIEASWTYMDSGKGFKFSIIYIGTAPEEFSWNAYIDGDKIDANSSFLTRVRWAPVYTVIIPTLSLIVIMFIALKVFRVEKYIMLRIYIIVTIFTIVFLFYNINSMASLAKPPF